MILTKDNFQRVENHNSHEENGEIVEEPVHQAWILDIGDVDQKTLEQVRDEILQEVQIKEKIEFRLENLKKQRLSANADQNRVEMMIQAYESLLGDKN